MKMFKYVDFKVIVDPELWTLMPFKALHDRDKSKDKVTVFKEVAFIRHYCDIKSDYLTITDLDARCEQIKQDVGLPENWKIDEKVKLAMDMYEQRTITPIARMYLDSVKSALDTTDYLSNAATLLRERTASGGSVTTVNSITSSLNSVNETMKKLKLAEKEVIKEQKELEGRMKGSQEMSMFEEGKGLYN